MSRFQRGLILSCVVGAALYLALAAVYGDLGKVSAHLHSYPLSLLCLAFVCASINYAFRFAKWQYYLALLGIEVPAGPSLGIFLSGFSLTVTPGKIGEVLKSYLLRQAYGVPVARSAPIVLGERLTDLIALLLLALVGVTTWMGPAERWLTGVGAGLCAVAVVVLSSRRLAHRALDLMQRLPPRGLTGRVVPKLRVFYDATALLIQPRALVVCTLLSILAWFSECVAFYLIVRGFPTASASLLLCTFIYALMTVAGALAFLPGGLGVTEGGMALLLVRLARGLDSSAAVAATLLIRIATLWFAVLLGIAALILFQRVRRVQVNLDELRRPAPPPPAESTAPR